MKKIIQFLLVAIKMFNIRFCFPTTTWKMFYFFSLNSYLLIFNSLKVTIWELGKNKFTLLSSCHIPSPVGKRNNKTQGERELDNQQIVSTNRIANLQKYFLKN